MLTAWEEEVGECNLSNSNGVLELSLSPLDDEVWYQVTDERVRVGRETARARGRQRILGQAFFTELGDLAEGLGVGVSLLAVVKS